MFSILNFFSSSDKFFKLLEESAKHVNATIVALSETLKVEKSSFAMDPFIELEVKDRNVSQEISDLLVQTFITSLEREDIEALAVAMHRIVKTSHKFAERYKSGFAYCHPVDFAQQLDCIIKATESLTAMIAGLRNMSALEQTKKLKDLLDAEERRADDIITDLIDDLYKNETNAIRLIVIRDLYDLMEKIVDRVRDAGDLVYSIVLKNS